MRIIFLGTAGSFPTIHRSLPAISIQRKQELFLLDCGEGLQRQMFSAKIGFRHKIKVFLTHMHGDHVLGLPGLLQTMSLFKCTRPVQIYGPHGTLDFLKSIMKTLGFHLTFPLTINEVGAGVVCTEKEYEVHCVWTEHGIPNLAYALIEKGRPGKFYPEKAIALGIPKGPLWSTLQKGEEIFLEDGEIVGPEKVMGPRRPGRKIVYSGDTKPCRTLSTLARNADLLIHEATFDDELAAKADEGGHSTPSQAAYIAQVANVKRLILTHISSRYRDGSLLRKQALKTFSRVEVAEDFIEVTVGYR